MSTMAMASSLNPNAPLFIPAAYRQVEDYSPEWWELIKTTAWFRDHWFRQHQLHEAAAAFARPDDSVNLLLDTDDLFYTPDHHHQVAKPAVTLPGYDLDMLRAVSLGSLRAGRASSAAGTPAAG